MKVARFVFALFVAAGISYLAHADALDLLKAGLAARRSGDLDAAIKFYSQAIATGSLSSANLAIVLGSRGIAFDMKGETDKAIEDFNEAIRLNADYDSAYIYRGLAWVKKHDYGRAISDFTEAITRDPGNPSLAFNDRANTYVLMGEYDRAIDDYGRAIQLNPSIASVYFNRAGLRYARGEYDDAIDDYSRAIDLNPAYAAAYNNRAVAYQIKAEIDKAIADFGSAVRLNPYNAAAHGNLGTIHATIGEFDRAVADFSSAIVLKPEVAGFYIKRAQARLYSGQLNAAITDLNTALTLDPSDAYAVIWLHLAHLRGRVDDMQEMRQAAAAIDRNKWPGAIVELFLVTSEPETVNAAGPANADRKSKSERECQEAFYLGIFELEKGDRTAAKNHLQAAADTCPSLFELAAAKAELTSFNSRR